MENKNNTSTTTIIAIFVILFIFEIFLVLLLMANWITGFFAIIGWIFFGLIIVFGIGLFAYWYIKRYNPDLFVRTRYILSSDEARDVSFWILRNKHHILSDTTKTLNYKEVPVMAGDDELTPIYHVRVRDGYSTNNYNIIMITDDFVESNKNPSPYARYPRLVAFLKNPSNFEVKDTIRNLTRKREKENISIREVRDEYGNVRATETTTSRINDEREKGTIEEKAVAE